MRILPLVLNHRNLFIIFKKNLSNLSQLYELKNVIKVSTNVQSNIPRSSEKFTGCPGCNTLQLSSTAASQI